MLREIDKRPPGRSFPPPAELITVLSRDPYLDIELNIPGMPERLYKAGLDPQIGIFIGREKERNWFIGYLAYSTDGRIRQLK